MSAGIKLTTPTTSSIQNSHIINSHASAVEEDEVCIENTTTANTVNIQQTNICEALLENSSSFSHLPSLQEQSSSGDYDDYNDDDNKVPLQQRSPNQRQQHEMALEENKSAASLQNQEFENNHMNSGGDSAGQLSPGLSLLQQAASSSPPPHSYRNSRAYRHFKNPPQPHMCIRTTSESGEELFINVLSWTRIVIPQEPSDPIPLYGGMRVPPGSPRSPPIVFAVMANPEVLKDSGRHSKDPEERRAMVELMCDFVEAMNPGVKLVRNAVILKDRDISGELKDVWNAVQVQRDREREEQMLQQRQQQQQQHYHNLANNTTNGSANTNPSQQMFPKSSLLGDGGMMLMAGEGTPPRTRKFMQELQNNDNNTSNIEEMEGRTTTTTGTAAAAAGGAATTNTTMSLALLAEQLDNKMSSVSLREEQEEGGRSPLISNGNDCKDSRDGDGKQQQDVSNQLNANNTPTQTTKNQQQESLTNGTTTTTTSTPAEAKTTNNSNINSSTIVSSAVPSTQQNAITPPTSTPAPPPPTKKEKLGGFLPNGCIFPRFTKNNKHKDKEKESKTKDKEKNILLNALKKSKDKKSNAAAAAAAIAVVAANQDDKLQQQEQNICTTTTSPSSITTNTANKQQKNCLQQLECGVQKLDLNPTTTNTTIMTTTTTTSSSSSSSSNKTKSPPSSTNNTNPTSTTANTSNTGVGVH